MTQTSLKVPDCVLEIREFDIQTEYYIHFWPNTPRKAYI